MRQLAIIIFASLVIYGCGGNNETEEGQDLLNDFAYADSLQSQIVISEEIIDEMIHSIPSPVEMTVLILATGASFDQSILADPEVVDDFASNHAKAINLGVYGAELGYLNIYGKTLLGVDYLAAIRTLAKDLGVEQFFDFQTMKQLASSSDNIDELINITTQGFSKMETFLREQNRTKASVMIVTGTFVEGLHIAGQIAAKKPNDGLKERIGEQKMSLNNLVAMLEVFESDPEVGKLIADFKELKTVYDAVEIVTTYGEPITKEVDGMLVIEDNSTSEVIMSDALLFDIIKKVGELRTKMVTP